MPGPAPLSLGCPRFALKAPRWGVPRCGEPVRDHPAERTLRGRRSQSGRMSQGVPQDRLVRIPAQGCQRNIPQTPAGALRSTTRQVICSALSPDAHGRQQPARQRRGDSRRRGTPSQGNGPAEQPAMRGRSQLAPFHPGIPNSGSMRSAAGCHGVTDGFTPIGSGALMPHPNNASAPVSVACRNCDPGPHTV